MDGKDKKYQQYVHILEEELVPAMGCTEPIAIAYAAARAAQILEKKPERILVRASGNIIKNVKSVVVPNTGGLVGIESAAAAGAVAGKAENRLEVIAEVTAEQQKEIQSFIKEKEITVEFLDSGMQFDLIVEVAAGSDCAKVRIAQYHTNIILEEKNGKVLFEKELETNSESGLTDRSVLNVKDILDFADTVKIADVLDVLKRQVDYNMAIAEEGLRNRYGAAIGQVLLAMYGDGDVRTRAKAWAAAGSDARMGGCELPVIINSGSGNQGMTVSIPVVVFARELKCSEEKMYRALVISNLLAIHQKTGIGRLSAYCGAVSAGSAAGAGICYLEGGGYEEISACLINSLAVTSGIICDGAKASCAAKIAFSIESALLANQMEKMGSEFKNGEGIVKECVESTISSVGRLGKDGMRETDKEILRIMTGC